MKEKLPRRIRGLIMLIKSLIFGMILVLLAYLGFSSNLGGASNITSSLISILPLSLVEFITPFDPFGVYRFIWIFVFYFLVGCIIQKPSFRKKFFLILLFLISLIGISAIAIGYVLNNSF